MTATKSARYYPAEDIKPVKVKPQLVANKNNPPKLRKSVQEPGTILILLAGRFRGKRVVLLKPLVESGLLLVTGPYAINGVPLRRVNPAYVIATRTRVNVSKIDVSAFTDAYFAREESSKSKSNKKEFFMDDAPEPAVVSDKRKADQQKVDAQLMTVIADVPMLEGYLAAHFTLTNNDKPHLMQF